MRVLLVGGTFDSQGGKSSTIISRMSNTLNCSTMNGGFIRKLSEIDFTRCDILIWMPNIDNNEEKILPKIKDPKTGNYKLLLVSSKNAVGRDYQYSDFIGRMLQTKSNLGIYIDEVNKFDDIKKFSLFDPLGNTYIQTTDITKLSQTLMNRIIYLKSLTRIGSVCLGEGYEFHVDKEFIDEIHSASDQFSKFVNANNPNRLLGNASTRCASGFPAFRDKNRFFVTRRNVDKTNLSERDFVEVKSGEQTVFYYGENKPSVDTAIQLRLLRHYPNINYMIHGHVYIDNAPKTDSKIPCGYIEEFDEIIKKYPDSNTNNISINLKGHGCLIAADTVEKLKNVKFIGRSFPES